MPLAPTRNIRTWTCKNCNTTIRIEDEAETTKCADPNCPVWLCPLCPQFHCSGCGLKFCIDHMIVSEPDYACECIRVDVDLDDASGCLLHNPSLRGRPDEFCAACLEEVEIAEQGGWPEIPKLEPVTAKVILPDTSKWGGAA